MIVSCTNSGSFMECYGVLEFLDYGEHDNAVSICWFNIVKAELEKNVTKRRDYHFYLFSGKLI